MINFMFHTSSTLIRKGKFAWRRRIVDTATTENEFKNSRPLDVDTWSDCPEVNDFVDSIYDHLGSITEHIKGNKKLLKVLLLDLYMAWSADLDLKIMFSRDNNSYKAKSRYNELHVGKKIIGIVDDLLSS